MKGLRHPATLLAALALFVALGGGAAVASRLVSGTDLVNHSVPEWKLTARAISSLRGLQGPPARRDRPGREDREVLLERPARSDQSGRRVR